MNEISELLNDLSAPVKSFRVFAIERAIQEGKGPILLDALRARQAEETDEECRLLLAHAVNAVQARTHPSPEPAVADQFTSEEFIDWYSKANPTLKIHMLGELTPASIPGLIPTLPKWMREETDPAVISALIRTFAPQWPKTALEPLSACLFSNYLIIRLTALEALIKISPEVLERDLPRLLVSDDPRIRALAIQGLSRIDLEEAGKHLDVMLQRSEVHYKICALQNCFYLPFESVKPMLLKFLAAESAPALLEKAGLLIQINSDVEVPYRLWEIITQASPEKAEICKRVLDGALSAIENSEILKDGFHAYCEKLKEFSSRLGLAKARKEAASPLMFASTSEEVDLEAAGVNSLPGKERQTALEEAIAWNPAPQAKDKIRALLAEKEGAPQPLPVGKDRYTLDNLSHDQKVRVVASWTVAERDKITFLLKSLISDSRTPVDLLTTALRTATRIEQRGLVEVSERLLKHPDERMISAALEYLAKNDPDRILPILGTYLQSPSLRLKSSALKILKHFDSARARSMISAMLSNKNPEQQALALSCMVHFDFPLIREILFAFAQGNPDSAQFAMAMDLFQANPDSESLYSLFCLEMTLPPDRVATAKGVRQRNQTVLVEMGILEKAKLQSLDNAFRERYRKENEKEKAPPAPYSLKSIRQQVSSPAKAPGSAWGFLDAALSGALVFLVFSSFFWFFSRKITSREPMIWFRGPAVGVPVTISGKVLETGLDSEGLMCVSDEKVKFVCLPPLRRFSGVVSGDSIKVSVVPFRWDPRGFLICQCHLLQKQYKTEKGGVDFRPVPIED